ncbi:hypothetical protein QA640_44065 (plasmid) [Bradyrhizobium sp. CB82]|nr:hypothetical protein [Bradyrhizobium sp. CB82]WFU45813.1 hypothetical protein QA640_44065 [Bradyrhizobium sp. CB82]
MLRFTPFRASERSRRRAIGALLIRHGAESTPEGRSLRLLRQWLSPSQQKQFAENGYFEVIGSESGKLYRIYPGSATNVCELDERNRLKTGLCFLPIGDLPIGDIMLAQKIALESCEGRVLAVARRFVPNVSFRRSRAPSLTVS